MPVSAHQCMAQSWHGGAWLQLPSEVRTWNLCRAHDELIRCISAHLVPFAPPTEKTQHPTGGPVRTDYLQKLPRHAGVWGLQNKPDPCALIQVSQRHHHAAFPLPQLSVLGHYTSAVRLIMSVSQTQLAHLGRYRMWMLPGDKAHPPSGAPRACLCLGHLTEQVGPSATC